MEGPLKWSSGESDSVTAISELVQSTSCLQTLELLYILNEISWYTRRQYFLVRSVNSGVVPPSFSICREQYHLHGLQLCVEPLA